MLVTGDTAVRAAHSLQAHPGIEEVVVVGPATSKSFRVVDSAEGLDYLVGSGPEAPRRARKHGIPLIWDGENASSAVAVWGAGPEGLTLALAARESEPRLVAVAHPELAGGSDHQARFPHPIGRQGVSDDLYAGHRVATAKSPNEFSAALAVGASRSVTIIDDGKFLSGIALAAGVAAVGETPRPVWDEALAYLQTATAMGLVMAEDK